MGRNSVIKSRISDPQKRIQIMEQVESLFLMTGFRAYTMDQVAEKIGMSKATIYNHLTNRKEIVDLILRIRLEKIVKALGILNNPDLSWFDAYSEGMKAVVSEVSIISPRFLEDVELEFPQLFLLIHQTLEHILLRLRRFYTLGIETKVIVNIDADFLVELDRQFIFNLTNHKWLVKHGWSIEEALQKYVDLRMKGISATHS